MTSNRADVVIAGAGIAGIATAYQLAEKHGMSDVVLVDPRPPLTFTSDKTGANYREWWPRRSMVTLVRRSVELMEGLLEGGPSFDMNRRGYLYVTTSAMASDSLTRLANECREAGIEPIRRHLSGAASSAYEPARAEGLSGPGGADLLLDPPMLRGMFPHLTHRVTGAIHARCAGSVDTVGLGRRLLALTERRGVLLKRGEVTGVELSGGRVKGVTIATDHGRQQIATERFVNAAGPFAGRVAALLGVSLPLVNVLQQKVTFPDPLNVVPHDAPFTICRDSLELPWDADERRRLRASADTHRFTERLPGGLHIKPGGIPERPVVKIGWAFNREPEAPLWEPRGSPEFPRAVLLGASGVIPGLEKYLVTSPTIVTHDAGYYVMTPDELPLIGPLGVDGGYVVGGLVGYGAMAACAVGEIAASWITGGERAPLAATYAPDRFADSAYVVAMKREESGAL